MVERQVRYNFKTDTGEKVYARHRWVFLIINEPREIKRIRERIYKQLQMITDLRDLDSGLIKSSGGLYYDFFAFSTDKSCMENPDKIYKSKKFKQDRNLYERDIAGL